MRIDFFESIFGVIEKIDDDVSVLNGSEVGSWDFDVESTFFDTVSDSVEEALVIGAIAATVEIAITESKNICDYVGSKISEVCNFFES
ncbi:hypothetical protein [Butyrivibrio sp. AE3004]|uniref:hypothetical protein n=1 Tax=Butyrivibrio sp. AE3004 TaxID=1506994 RepID=UPI0004940A96|nr:hypothetical protein [Butyrivibrio sp. AE3004]